MRIPRRAHLAVLYGLVAGLFVSCASIRAATENATQLALGAGVGGLAGYLVAGPWGLLLAGAVGALTAIMSRPPVVVGPGGYQPTFIEAYPFWAIAIGVGLYVLWIRREWVARAIKDKGIRRKAKALAHGFIGTRRPQ